MMLTILRTAFLAYVRVLLCLQGLYLGFWAWTFWVGVFRPSPVSWPGQKPHPWDWVPLGLALLFTFLSLSGIVVAILLRRGRRWAAVTAILAEGLLGMLAAALWYKTIKDWPIDWQTLQLLTVLAALFLAAAVGLLLPPVRAYAGLVRR